MPYTLHVHLGSRYPERKQKESSNSARTPFKDEFSPACTVQANLILMSNCRISIMCSIVVQLSLKGWGYGAHATPLLPCHQPRRDGRSGQNRRRAPEAPTRGRPPAHLTLTQARTSQAARATPNALAQLRPRPGLGHHGPWPTHSTAPSCHKWPASQGVRATKRRIP
eukprot:scaffold121944_cov37-Tisochrysis_lutea.AAC.1